MKYVATRIQEGTSLIEEVETKDIKLGLEFCIINHYTSVVMETLFETLTMKNILDEKWNVP